MPNEDDERAREDALMDRMDAILDKWYLSAICNSAGFTEEQKQRVFVEYQKHGLIAAEGVAEYLEKLSRNG